MHDQSVKEIVSKFGTDLEQGLTSVEARHRLSKFGRNKIEQAKDTSVLLLILRQFNSPIVFLLFFAATLSFAYSKWGDGFAVLIVLLINACIGFFMEFHAERSMTALRRLTKSFAKVIRNGTVCQVPTAEIVPGDLLYIEAGDIIPADARLCSSFQFQVDESAMTGESIPSEKSVNDLPPETTLADRINMLYKGTFATRGNAKAIVVATGMMTELGKIAVLVQSSQDSATPIEEKLEQFSKKLVWITLLIALAIFFVGIINGKSAFDMLNTVVALSVAAIPEGLPIVATLALAHGMMKMARRNVIVRKLASVETLGGTNVICTDKTGTLTYNKISVSHFVTADFHSLKASAKTQSAEYILDAFVLCNNAQISDSKGNDIELGDPLEVGLLQFAASRHMDISGLKEKFAKVSEAPFNSETKLMTTLHSGPEKDFLYAKGASESVLPFCSYYLNGNVKKKFTKSLKEQWLRRSDEEASEGYKVISFAMKRDIDKEDTTSNLTDLTFLGIVSLIDAARKDVPNAIRLCHDAGIRVVMITGDHPSTARKIAHQIGISFDSTKKIIHGSSMPSFDELTQEQKDKWKSTVIFARVSPNQKLDLIRVLQENHDIVAMTGDGVNDAPALKKADIGIAMGLRGTDVAKEVADMVLKDDAFPSIVAAIKEGRIIFENIRKFLMFLLSSNLSEILVIATLFVTGSPLSLVPLQILFINLLSDVFPALALGLSKGSAKIMNRPPRNPKKPVLSNLQWMSVIVYAVIIAASSFSSSLFIMRDIQSNANVLKASTVLFYTLILAQLLHVFNVGDHRQNFFNTDIIRNVYVWFGTLLSILLGIAAYFIHPARQLLHLGELDLKSVIIIIACGLQSLIFIQLLKRLHLIH